ncbi:aerobic respiration control sensor protein ArcB [Phaeobacter sp. CECT 5382]|uniref:response regulator n=1 Tax=Phaeobacter sp. CECT 5382 TaxID=1712645 RepID=UPI0006DA5EF6|nr:response regulator [Phaeobacter sp. CECT 5382]CUH89691.1 aerobic respiration control sensor protein ArcB [Phaeobacter sp. CECT 5382]
MNRSLKLLYVEDDQFDAAMLVRSFERYAKDMNCHIQIAETVSEAIAQISQTAFDAVLLDWNLTDGSGPDVASHMRATNISAPIIFLSGAWVGSQLAEAENYETIGCLNKVYDRNQIEGIYNLVLRHVA